MIKQKVAFVCVHNSCRSQIAEAFCKIYRKEYEAYSAGTEVKSHLNEDAVRIMKDFYNIDISMQYSKLLKDIPDCDIYISMGCNGGCTFVEKGFNDNFNIEDPTGKSDEEFIKVIEEIKRKVVNFKEKTK